MREEKCQKQGLTYRRTDVGENGDNWAFHNGHPLGSNSKHSRILFGPVASGYKEVAKLIESRYEFVGISFRIVGRPKSLSIVLTPGLAQMGHKGARMLTGSLLPLKYCSCP